jgi:hypothetical protein
MKQFVKFEEVDTFDQSASRLNEVFNSSYLPRFFQPELRILSGLFSAGSQLHNKGYP